MCTEPGRHLPALPPFPASGRGAGGEGAPLTPHPSPLTLTTGFTLVEAVLFMVVVSVALTVVLKAFDMAGRGSADPLLRRQSLAIAQALIEEIQAMPFGDAASDDPAQGGFAGPYTAANRARFDDVDDYDGLALPGITTLANVALDGLNAYSASVAVEQAAFGAVPAGAGYRITVQVTDPAGQTLRLQAYRANY
ncbi:MAG: hypothetical protein AB1899_11245 [Pseudomonadota bacterium]